MAHPTPPTTTPVGVDVDDADDHGCTLVVEPVHPADQLGRLFAVLARDSRLREAALDLLDRRDDPGGVRRFLRLQELAADSRVRYAISLVLDQDQAEQLVDDVHAATPTECTYPGCALLGHAAGLCLGHAAAEGMVSDL